MNPDDAADLLAAPLSLEHLLQLMEPEEAEDGGCCCAMAQTPSAV